MQRDRSVIPWLLFAVATLIVYGSLYPFNFKADAFDGGVMNALTQLSWQRAGRGDRIANVLLYLPFGFCLFLWAAARFGRLVSFALATLIGGALSLTIEIAQVYVSIRVPSLTDLTLNTLGSLLGATGGLAWRGLTALMHVPSRAEKPARDPGAVLVIALWLMWRFAPFVPQLDLAKLKTALKPLFSPQFEPVAVFTWLSCWLVINQAIAALFSRPRRLEALLIVIAVVLIGRLIVANQTFVPSELLALLLVLPLVVLMHRMTPAPRRAALVLAVSAVLLIEGLAPFQFAARHASFDFWPFMTWFEQGLIESLSMLDWEQLFAQFFLSAALLWVLREWGAPLNVALGVTIALAVAIEALRIFSPQHEASITDPLTAAAVAWSMRSLYLRRGGPRATLRTR